MPPIRSVDGGASVLARSPVALPLGKPPRTSSGTSYNDPISISSSSDSDSDHTPASATSSKQRSARKSTGVLSDIRVNAKAFSSKSVSAWPVPRPRASQSLPKVITIRGTQLQPTVVFDTFWQFAAERKAIDDKRRAGLAAPWTNDQILRQWPFCNTYRVLDRVTQYLITEVIEKGSQEPNDVAFRIVLFNTFTKIQTWELLQKELGPLSWDTYDRDAYRVVLDRAKNKGKTLYTGAFQKPGPNFGFKDTHMNHLALLEVFMENDLPAKLAESEYMADIFEWLIAFPGMGGFNTYQLLLNLSYCSVSNFSGNDFVVAGLGAKSGLAKMFGRSLAEAREEVPGIEEDIIRWMAKTQNQHFKRLGLEFTGLGPNQIPMELADIEHTVCEVDKYSRIAHPHIKGLHGRTHLRGSGFKPSAKPLPTQARLPKAWSHPDRMILRIRPGGPPVVNKRYVVRSIAGRRETSNGVEYHIYWWGYDDKDATWEPEEELIKDAPQAVAEFLQKNREISYF